MSAPDHRTDPGFDGWGWDDIVERLTALAAWRAEQAGQAVTAAPWPDRIERAANLVDSSCEGATIAGVYPATLMDALPDFLPAALAAADLERLADEDAAGDEDPVPPVVRPPHLPWRAPGRPCTDLVVRAKTPLPTGQREGDELEDWARHVAAVLPAAHPEVRAVHIRGRGHTRRELHLAVRVPRDRRPAEYVRTLVEQVDLGPLPGLPLLDVLVTV